MRNGFRHNRDEDAEAIVENTAAADMAIFAQRLLNRRTPDMGSAEKPLPAPVTPLGLAAFGQSIEERDTEEQKQRTREQTLLSATLTQIKRKARARKRCLQLFGVAGAAALGLGGLMLIDAVSVSMMNPAFLIASFVALFAATRGTRLHSHIIQIVPTLPTSEIRAIGPLLEALSYADMDGIPQVALMELLPRLMPADAVLFSDAQRQNLHRALTDTNTDLVAMVLKALEKVGDGRAIPHVAHLAAGKGRARIDPQVLYAAQRCLPILEARAVYDAANQTLLRAAAPPLLDGEQLLRSDTRPADTDSNELLRSQPGEDVPA